MHPSSVVFVLPPQQPFRHAGTRWRRSAVVLVPSLAVLVGLIVAMSRGIIPVSVAMSDQAVTLSADAVRTGDPLAMTGGTAGASADLSMTTATLDRACLAVVRTIPGTGLRIGVVLSMPGAGTLAHNLNVGSARLALTSAEFDGTRTEPIVLGAAANEAMLRTDSGGFSFLSGPSSTMSNVRIDSTSFLTATVTPGHGARMSVVTGSDRANTCG